MTLQDKHNIRTLSVNIKCICQKLAFLSVSKARTNKFYIYMVCLPCTNSIWEVKLHWLDKFYTVTNQEKFEDTKGVIRSRKSKDKKKRKSTKWQTMIHKTLQDK
jgi:hypothetical protein